MHTSRRLWAWALLPALLGTAAAGCARVAARPPEPPPERRTLERLERRALDPSEEITPGELASIPEPVPPGQAGPGQPDFGQAGPGQPGPGQPGFGPEEAAGPSSAPDVGQTPEAARSPSTGLAAGDNGGSRQVWRVQIFASEDLQLAGRKGKEAAERLQVRAHLEFEAPYYKVRLGDFATEEEAQALREQAIRTGYPGAFRTRCVADISQDRE